MEIRPLCYGSAIRRTCVPCGGYGNGCLSSLAFSLERKTLDWGMVEERIRVLGLEIKKIKELI